MYFLDGICSLMQSNHRSLLFDQPCNKAPHPGVRLIKAAELIYPQFYGEKRECSNFSLHGFSGCHLCLVGQVHANICRVSYRLTLFTKTRLCSNKFLLSQEPKLLTDVPAHSWYVGYSSGEQLSSVSRDKSLNFAPSLPSEGFMVTAGCSYPEQRHETWCWP